jgi:aryl-alcohol dehydrogenase-like predicted oxidoreductase
MGVVVKEALANGRLTPRNDDPAFAANHALLLAQAQRLGCTVDALALAGALAQPWASVVLSGAATVEHVRSNAAAAAVAWDAEAEDALAALIEPAEEYWQRRAALAWN